jgi:hypothetical protein
MYSILTTEPSLEHSQPLESLLSVCRPCHARGAQLGAEFRCTRLIGGAIRQVCPEVHGDGGGVPTQFHGDGNRWERQIGREEEEAVQIESMAGDQKHLGRLRTHTLSIESGVVGSDQAALAKVDTRYSPK